MKAVRIEGHTLIGVGRDERPSNHGNCFSVQGDDGEGYRIVNFNLENLEALQKLGLTWPIPCKIIEGRVAIIHDGRIGERWYQNRYCEVCCPESLLPVTQKQEHERDEMRGRRKSGNGYVSYNLVIKPEFP